MLDNQELGSTVENFASRIRRKLKEQEAQQSVTSKAASERQALILKAMTAVRKGLQEASKISLGGRFRFELEISDWEGWPKLDLRLIDLSAPHLETQSLIATAHDRNELGCIQLQMRTGEILGTVHLRDPEEFKRLPLVLKKGLRTFLDFAANMVLNPTNIADTLEAQTAPIEDANLDETTADLREVNLFSDDEGYSQQSNRVEIEDAPSANPFAFGMPLKA